MILAQAFARFAFDLDGVVWKGDRPIAGAPETIRTIRDAGKRVAFVTNNSSETHETYAKKLAEMGAGGSPDEVVSSADATARLLEKEVPSLQGRVARRRRMGSRAHVRQTPSGDARGAVGRDLRRQQRRCDLSRARGVMAR